ncbi:MAG: hypothetical protein AAF804_17980, partial [Bacteroidota bacterium]
MDLSFLRYELGGGRVLRYELFDGKSPLTQAQVTRAWVEDPDFVQWWSDLLASVDFKAFFWELPPQTLTTQNQAFEFVLVDSPALAAIYADQSAFAPHFARAKGDLVLSFGNLGGDAQLVVPTPRQGKLAYPHLAAFLRRAAVDQQLALWQRLGKEITQHLSGNPLWISTSGLGVYWLHLRLDQR